MQNQDECTIQAVLDGDTESFGVLIRKYQTPVYNLMLRTIRNVEDATDLTQETFLRAFHKLHTYTPGKNFFSWIYAIGINLARDSLRKKKRRRDLMQADDSIWAADWGYPRSDADSETGREEMLALHQAMLSLPLEYREALILRFREGLSMKELARILGLSESGAKMRVHRGLQQLRTILGGQGDETKQE